LQGQGELEGAVVGGASRGTGGGLVLRAGGGIGGGSWRGNWKEVRFKEGFFRDGVSLDEDESFIL